jgi:hypothetical protein
LLRSGRAKEIVTHKFGSAPDGLLPVLERLGPLSAPESYRRVWAMFMEADGRKARALRDVGEITARTIRVLDMLDPVLVHAEVLKRIETAAQAHDLNHSVRFAIRRLWVATGGCSRGAQRPRSSRASGSRRGKVRQHRHSAHRGARRGQLAKRAADGQASRSVRFRSLTLSRTAA